MNLFLLRYIFVCVLALVQCQEFSHLEPTEPHHHTVIGVSDCANGHLKPFRETKMNAVLKARERHVILIPQEGYEYEPPTVTVKRCNGRCTNLRSPMPVRTQIKEFIVQRQLKGDHMSAQCVSVNVTEHTMCKCMCMMDDTYCGAGKYFEPSICDCKCQNRETEKPKCEKSHHMKKWFDADCSCRCSNTIMDCMSGMQWDYKECSCIPEQSHRTY